MPQHLQATAQDQGGDGLSHHRMTSARRTAAGDRSGRRPRPGCVNPREGVDGAEPTGIPQGRPAQGGDGAEPTGIPQGQPATRTPTSIPQGRPAQGGDLPRHDKRERAVSRRALEGQRQQRAEQQQQQQQQRAAVPRPVKDRGD